MFLSLSRYPFLSACLFALCALPLQLAPAAAQDDQDPLLDYAGICNSKVSDTEKVNIPLFGACPLRLDLTDSESCVSAKQNATGVITSKCENAGCEPPTGINCNCKFVKGKPDKCSATCTGLCGKKKATLTFATEMQIIFGL